MSFEDTHCPCGGKKRCGVMLCDKCVSSMEGRPELSDYEDENLQWDSRRAAAIRLCMMARKMGGRTS